MCKLVAQAYLSPSFSPACLSFFSSLHQTVTHFRSVPGSIKHSELKPVSRACVLESIEARSCVPSTQVTRGICLLSVCSSVFFLIEYKQTYKKMLSVTRPFKQVWHLLHSDIPAELASVQGSLVAKR